MMHVSDINPLTVKWLLRFRDMEEADRVKLFDSMGAEELCDWMDALLNLSERAE